MKSKFCKLIITFAFTVIAFLTCNLVAFADPLTAAMIAGSSGMGFGWTAFAGMPAGTSSDFADRAGFSGLTTWAGLAAGPNLYITINEGTTKDTVVIGPDISQSIYDRTRYFANYFGLNPDSVYQFGSVKSYNGYYFSKQLDSHYFVGPYVGYLDGTTHFSISPDYYVDYTYNANEQPTSLSYVIGNKSGTNTQSTSYKNLPLVAGIYVSGNTITNYYWRLQGSSGYFNVVSASGTGISAQTTSVDVTRSADSEILNPNSGSYQITVPHGSFDPTTYQDGIPQTDKNLLEKILEKLEELADDDDIEDLIVIQPVPPTSDTVSETPWTSFTTWFDDYFSGWTESFGDIYDGLVQFQESFGDWVEDVASGWTEVFGDIYDTLSGFTEVFGDIYDSIVDGFGSIADTLEGIYEYVADIVQEIVNADANWVNGFINNFLSQFQGWFDTLKQHVSIWHYVVEWLASIRSVFTFFFGVLSSTGYNFVLPIYACFAGTVVIAIYRRFGK